MIKQFSCSTSSMDIFSAIILAVVQGITEWLPVSSSGHLVLVGSLLGVESNILFDVALHLSSLLVVILVSWKNLWSMIKALFTWNTASEDFKLIIALIIGTLPAAIIGLLFKDLIEAAFSKVWLVGLMLIVTGTYLMFGKLHTKSTSSKISYRNALLIGISQSAALFPGISRSGSTITTGLLKGISAEKAASFSFLLFIPAALGAGVLQMGGLSSSQIEFAPLIIGVIVTFVVGYISLRWLLKLVRKGKLYLFSYYCWLIGALTIIFSLTQSI